MSDVFPVPDSLAQLGAELHDVRAREREIIRAQIGLAREVVPQFGRSLMHRHQPKLTQVTWTQRDGTFSDDGPCTGITLHTITYDGHEYVGVSSSARPGWRPEVRQIIKETSALLGLFHEQALYAVFGGYNLVILTASGVQVQAP